MCIGVEGKMCSHMADHYYNIGTVTHEFHLADRQALHMVMENQVPLVLLPALLLSAVICCCYGLVCCCCELCVLLCAALVLLCLLP